MKRRVRYLLWAALLAFVAALFAPGVVSQAGDGGIVIDPAINDPETCGKLIPDFFGE